MTVRGDAGIPPLPPRMPGLFAHGGTVWAEARRTGSDQDHLRVPHFERCASVTAARMVASASGPVGRKQ
jgi:hypothetical protein